MMGNTKLHLTIVRYALLIICVIGMAPLPGYAWYSDQFEFRRTITFDTTPMGADIPENLSDVTVLIRLHTGNFDFSRVREDGQDLRFVAADDETPLKYTIERFDALEELAFVWVRVPKVSGASDQEYIYLYYGNASAADGQSPDQTFGNRYVGVYHLGETEGKPDDFSGSGNTPSEFTGGLGFPGVVGNGVTLNGMGDRMVLGESPSLNFQNGLTFSTWLKISATQNDAFLFYQEINGRSIYVAVDGTKIYAGALDETGRKSETDRSLDLPFNSWHHLTVSFAPQERISLYLDGIQMGWVPLKAIMPDRSGKVLIGASAKSFHFFSGELDEIKLSDLARQPAMIRAQYVSQGPDGNLMAVGEEVTGGGGAPSFYIGAVARNITADGWIVIGALFLLSILSWIVFLGKTVALVLMNRENRSFLSSFEKGDDLLSLSVKTDEFPNSPLFKVYQEGCESLKNGSETLPSGEGMAPPVQTGPILCPKRLNAFKTSLEKGFVMQGKRLNAGLVVLTMAISGGPFLGLLGTVWGVMNTFAAMAEAGEANIMAIAPGVASALATTVVGLIVAIPALFAYNYLAGRVKGQITDISIFIDEFTVKADERYGVQA